MKREDAKDLAMSIVAIVVVVLVVDSICLHVKCARQSNELAVLSMRLEQHISPPPSGSSLTDKAKQTYKKVKSAAVKGYQAAKEELDK